MKLEDARILSEAVYHREMTLDEIVQVNGRVAIAREGAPSLRGDRTVTSESRWLCGGSTDALTCSVLVVCLL